MDEIFDLKRLYPLKEQNRFQVLFIILHNNPRLNPQTEDKQEN